MVNASHRPVEPPWLAAGALVLAVHGAILFGLLTVRAPLDPIPAGPAVLVELLAPDEPAPEVVDEPDVPTPPPEPPPPPPEPTPVVRTPIAVPPVAAPLPEQVVAAPPPPPEVSEPAPAPAPSPVTPPKPVPKATAAEPSASAPAASPDPRAKKQEADYFSLVNAHLARNKRYPRKARRARQQGVVTVRFTVHRDGRISAAEIRQSSGQELLDAATLDLLQRVSPLPRFPREMTRESVTVTLPIDYSLRTD